MKIDQSSKVAALKGRLTGFGSRTRTCIKSFKERFGNSKLRQRIKNVGRTTLAILVVFTAKPRQSLAIDEIPASVWPAFVFAEFQLGRFCGYRLAKFAYTNFGVSDRIHMEVRVIKGIFGCQVTIFGTAAAWDMVDGHIADGLAKLNYTIGNLGGILGISEAESAARKGTFSPAEAKGATNVKLAVAAEAGKSEKVIGNFFLENSNFSQVPLKVLKAADDSPLKPGKQLVVPISEEDSFESVKVALDEAPDIKYQSPTEYMNLIHARVLIELLNKIKQDGK